jgi:chloramphenicol 3-O-phosphotransferase
VKTIAASLARDNVIGERVTLPWEALNRKLKLHTRELVLVAGAPAAGKSVFALNIVMSRELRDEPVLYFAQDSVPSVLGRLTALALNEPIDLTMKRLRDPDQKPEVLEELQDVRPHLFIHAGAVTYEAMELRMQALSEVYGKAPKLVIIDNLIDTIVPGSHHQETGFYAQILNQLKQCALDLDSCIVALHHVTRRGGDRGDSPHGLGTRKLKMTDSLHGGEREAEHVLGVFHSTNQDRMYIQILKQRDGVADPEGGVYTPLVWQPPMGRLERRG